MHASKKRRWVFVRVCFVLCVLVTPFVSLYGSRSVDASAAALVGVLCECVCLCETMWMPVRKNPGCVFVCSVILCC